jgi:predicted metalloendopeptidase
VGEWLAAEVRNVDARAFDVKPEKMYLGPQQRVKIW